MDTMSFRLFKPCKPYASRLAPRPSDPTIRLVDAEQCVTFFRRLAVVTGAAIADHLGIPAP